MMFKLLSLATLLCLLPGAVRGFSPVTSFSPARNLEKPSSSRLFVSFTNKDHHHTKQEDYNEGSPATVFGKPLDEKTKQLNRDLVYTMKRFIFDVLYAGETQNRAYARFWALETIARIPYFSYLSVLHLYETLGKWRKAEYLELHFSEDWNELHHLLIMEELGGNKNFFDRFIAEHIAFFYYWIVVALYVFNPTWAYNINQAVEEEAFQTYDNFLTQNQEYLKQQPAPAAAVDYYLGDNLYMFDAISSSGEKRRPVCKTLYDTFVNVRNDEAEHAKTMAYLQGELSPLD